MQGPFLFNETKGHSAPIYEKDETMSYIRTLNIIRGNLEDVNLEENDAYGVHEPHEFLSPREEVAIEMAEIWKRDDGCPEISLWVFTPLEEDLAPWRKLCAEQEEQWVLVIHQQHCVANNEKLEKVRDDLLEELKSGSLFLSRLTKVKTACCTVSDVVFYLNEIAAKINEVVSPHEEFTPAEKFLCGSADPHPGNKDSKGNKVYGWPTKD